MTGDGAAAAVAWAYVGRCVDGLAADLTAQGFEVVVTWDRPHDHVKVLITPPPVAP